MKCWNPETWDLSPAKEIVIKKYFTFEKFGE
jgi:hypothetical protein